MGFVPTQSTQQLAEVLAGLAASAGEEAAARCGIERIAESFEAEVGALVRDGEVIASVGFPAGRVPLDDLLAAAAGRRPTLEVPGCGSCPLVVVPVTTEPPATMLLARSGDDGFDVEEVGLLRAMSRVLAIALNMLNLLGRERALQEQTRSILDAASDAFLSLDTTGTVLAWNDQAAALFGWKHEEAVGRDMVEMIVPPRYRAQFRQRLERVASTGHDDALNRRFETFALYRDGHEFPVEFGAWVTSTGSDYTINAFVHDISERKAAADRLARQALHDPLTGLPNRELFLDRLGQALHHLTRRDRVLAVMFVDLDRFKQINDTLGHAAGDRVLLGVTDRLREVLRVEDTVARLGGDEFTILCPELPADGAIDEIAGRVLDAVREPIHFDGTRVVVSASIGVAVATHGTQGAEAVLREADSAMYEAKQLGRNRYEIFDQDMRARTEARLDESRALRQSLERDELRIAFQPIIDLADETTAGVEALVRWDHPDLGVVGPDHFIALAEDTRFVVPLGAWVLGEAVRQTAAWRSPGGRPPQVSVNLSARQLAEPSLVTTVAAILNESGYDPGRLCLEITETVLMEDIDASREALRSLKRLGVSVAIDDFGTGYSSLAYLRSFHVDAVKIDRSFVAGLGLDATTDAIVSAVINLAHSLGLRVVAEGVETREQLAALQGLGCDQAQGFYWSRPMMPAEARDWVERPRVTVLNPEPVDVGVVLAERAQVVRARTGRSVVLRGPVRLPPAVADPVAAVSVVDQMLKHAVVGSAPDRPVMVSTSADRNWVRVSVSDFGRSRSAHDRGPVWAEGELATTRQLVESMGGRLAVRSAPRGAGSVTTLALPRSAPAGARVTDADGAALDVGARSVVGEFMRQLGIVGRRSA
jgi:diguanylate cyclase (GGDEF)-like protein/PAS domain S-box-containing protein